jgi:hypothetical protein
MLDVQHPSAEGDSGGYPNLKGKRILIVEDDPVVAVDYHFQLKDVGAKAAGSKRPTRKP